jgi:hypothetical protein
MVLRAMLQLLAICSLDNPFSHFSRRTSFMIRMDNLSAAISASRIFVRRLTAFFGFIQRHPRPFQGWRNQSEWGGGMDRNQVAACAGIRI